MAKNLLSSLGISPRRWASENLAPAQNISQTDSYLYGAQPTTVAALLGSGRRAQRARTAIYQKWADMEANPLCSTALMLLVTSALGGHETTGDVVFIEKSAAAEKDAKLGKIAEEISEALGGLFNSVAYNVAYTGSSFGDAYARIYADGRGVTDLYIEEMVRPPLVQPYERGTKTLGFAVYIGERNFEKLDVSQMARMKMPRTQYVPQNGLTEKSLRLAITENDVDKLPLMPSPAGGSLLYNAEEAYDNLVASLMGLVGQRWMDSIDEQMVSVNLESMTLEQQNRFLDSIKTMLTKSKTLAEDAIKNGRPVMERIRHIIPTFNEKQVTQITGQQASRSSTITVDDVIFHAKLLAGSLGVDLSMIGFADMLSGGLGEGGFFRMSAQAAERARIIRKALSVFFDSIIDIHTYHRYGVIFPVNARPWSINYYGSISALESERQKTRSDAMNGGMILAQAIQMFKDTGSSEDMMKNYLSKEMLLDEDQAKLYAAIVKQKTEEGEGGDGVGGFGGGNKGGFGE
jgi:hypothetical protein